MDMRKVSQHAHALMARFVRRGSDDSLFFWTFVVFETTPEKLLPTCKCRMQQLNKLPVQGTLSRNHLRIDLPTETEGETKATWVDMRSTIVKIHEAI